MLWTVLDGLLAYRNVERRKARLLDALKQATQMLQDELQAQQAQALEGAAAADIGHLLADDVKALEACVEVLQVRGVVEPCAVQSCSVRSCAARLIGRL